MKKMFKSAVAVVLGVIMVFGGAPAGALVGLDLSWPDWLKSPFSFKASAEHTWAVGDVGTFGSYPQTRVTDSTLLTALNAETLTWVSYGYYSGTGDYGTMTQSDYMKYADVIHNGEKYRAVEFTSYRPYYTYYLSSTAYSYQDDNGYSTGIVYWFKYEPLKWRVLDPDNGLLLCESIIDSQDFYPTLTYPTWADSRIRIELNDLFYNTAFTNAEQMVISNLTVSTPDYGGHDGGIDTTDKLFLLSFEEARTTAYGFSSGITIDNAARRARGSDYAKCQGLYVCSDANSYYGKSHWWLRSPGYNSISASNIYNQGNIGNGGTVNITYIGVRPAFKISNLLSLSLISSEDIPVASVSLDKDSILLTAPETAKLNATIEPTDATDLSVTWTSSDEKIATVDGTGLVTAMAAGAATITVTAKDMTNGTFSDICEVTVNADHEWKVGDIGTFGSYPQTRVTDETLLAALNAETLTWVSYGYYSGTDHYGTMTQSDYMKYADVAFSGDKYRAVHFTSYRPCGTIYSSSASASFQDDNGYSTNTTYWFKYEPLRWRMLDPTSGLVMCESIIDSQAYSNTIYGSNPYYNSSVKALYANDYATSSVRTWLNGWFLQTTFTSSEQSVIATTTLDNSAVPGYSQYNSASTNDKLFLLSYSDSTNTAYGFSSSTITDDTARRSQGTDYAKCQGLYVKEIGSSYYGNSSWWLRSPDDTSSSSSYIGNGGRISNFNHIVCGSDDGIRPAFVISNLSSLNIIPVTEVSLDEESIELTVGETEQLSATVDPTDATNKIVGWTSSNKNVATVDSTGLITAKAAGKATITVTANDATNGTISDTCSVRVNKIDVQKLVVEDIHNQTYMGCEITPMVVATYNGDTLSLNTDYRVSYTKNINAGVANAKISGEGIFTGLIIYSFTIEKANAADFTVTPISDQAYTGSAITPTVDVKFNGETLTLNTDYTVSYTSNTNAGTATATITGMGNFTSTTTATFTINKADDSGFDVAAIPDQTYSGSMITPEIIVTYNGTTLTLNTDYTVAYTNNTNAGTASVTITGKGNFTGTTTATFNIIPANASSFTVTAIPDHTYAGSAITPTVDVKFNGTTLVLDTDYTLSYTNNTNVGTASVTITGKYNFTGTMTETFIINAANASSFTVTAIPDQTYTGSVITPMVTVKFSGKTLVLDTDYTLSYTNNINVGTATVTIMGIGNFEGTKTVTFEIVSVPVTGITLSNTALSLQYKGTGKLAVTFNPTTATNKNVTWTSSNEKVAIVDANGNVTAKGTGTATITATTVDGGKTASCTVTVKLVWWQWLIKIMLFGWIWY